MADKPGKLSPEDIEALSPKVMAAADSTLGAKGHGAAFFGTGSIFSASKLSPKEREGCSIKEMLFG